MTSGSSITLRPNGWSPISSLHATAYQVLRKYSMLTPSPARARLWIRVRATTFLSPGPCRANQAASRARSIGFQRATFFQLSDISQLLHSKDCEFQLFWCKFSLCFPGLVWDRLLKLQALRSEERRVGKGGVRSGRLVWAVDK